MSFLKKTIEDSIYAKRSLLLIEPKINLAVINIYKKLKKGGKIFLCGNGGSAADAQHLAAEFLVRLRPTINRSPIAAISLATDVSTLTACGNDFSFEKIFSRNLDALASPKDILLVISTSGNSKNIIDVLKMSKKKKYF
jgi:D-sedoheptulose 7-phosphate isomerase